MRTSSEMVWPFIGLIDHVAQLKDVLFNQEPVPANVDKAIDALIDHVVEMKRTVRERT